MKPYPTYKDSGIEWLGQIPIHWEMKRLKFGVQLVNEKAEPDDNADFQVALENIESGTGGLIGNGSFSGIGNRFCEGDVLFNKLRPYLAKAILAPRDGTAVGELLVFRPSQEVNAKFLLYRVLSREFISIVDGSTYGAKMPRASWDFIGNLSLPFPTANEQMKIAAFLDEKTAGIDALIAKKRRQIELLQEQRAALINQAVTKGLNPDVPMKDSGVEWIGRVPAHWNVKSYKHVTDSVIVGIAQAATHAYASEGIPIVRSTNIRPNYIDTDDILFIDPTFAVEMASKTVYAGDILTVRTGNAGISAVVPLYLDGCQCFTLLISTPSRGQVPQFYSYLLNSDVGKTAFKLEGWGTAQINISVPILQELQIVEPPLHEQKGIVSYIQTKTNKMDQYIDSALAQIQHLREYRTALISTAVTGKIDVRDYAAQKEAIP